MKQEANLNDISFAAEEVKRKFQECSISPEKHDVKSLFITKLKLLHFVFAMLFPCFELQRKLMLKIINFAIRQKIQNVSHLSFFMHRATLFLLYIIKYLNLQKTQ